jgi:ADP-ribose pyrophosphatase YjhB (NUDIX family)
VRRELREELGVAPRALRFVGFASDRYGPRGVPLVTIVFRATLPAASLRPSDDVAAIEWVDRRRIPWTKIAFPGLRKLLRRHLR